MQNREPDHNNQEKSVTPSKGNRKRKLREMLSDIESALGEFDWSPQKSKTPLPKFPTVPVKSGPALETPPPKMNIL